MTEVKITADSMSDYVARIIATWDSATADQLAAGRAWYSAAGQHAERITDGNRAMGAGIIAALSPLTSWSLNVRNAEAVASGQSVGTLKANLAKAQRMANGEHYASVLSAGSKTWNFAHNIDGHTDNVTIDRWAIRIAVGYDKTTVTPKQYDVLADAYRKAAAEIGEPASTVQAVTWCAIRGTGE